MLLVTGMVVVGWILVVKGMLVVGGILVDGGMDVVVDNELKGIVDSGTELVGIDVVGVFKGIEVVVVLVLLDDIEVVLVLSVAKT